MVKAARRQEQQHADCAKPEKATSWRDLNVSFALRAAAQHHLLGLVAGSAAFLSPSVCAWPELQLFVAIVLAAGLPSFLKLPLQVCADLSQPSLLGVAGAAIDVLGKHMTSSVQWIKQVP